MTLEHAVVRETLIKVTLDLLETQGLEGVKARAVAQAAGVSVGTIYNLFGSFDALILAANMTIYETLGALGAQRVAAIDAKIEQRIASGKLVDTPRNRMFERLLDLAEAYVDFVDSNANRWSALLAFNRTRMVSGTEENIEHVNALIDIIGSALKDAPAFRSANERRLASRALWSAVHGVVTTNFFGSDAGSARRRTTELLKILINVCVDGMFAGGAAPAGKRSG